jgi:hypothetical protein
MFINHYKNMTKSHLLTDKEILKNDDYFDDENDDDDLMVEAVFKSKRKYGYKEGDDNIVDVDYMS